MPIGSIETVSGCQIVSQFSASETLNLALEASRGSWAQFTASCREGSLSQFAAAEIQRTQVASDFYDQVQETLNSLR